MYLTNLLCTFSANEMEKLICPQWRKYEKLPGGA